MIPILARSICNNELLKPFDASSTDLSWYNSSQWASMIRSQRFAIHLVGEHNTPTGVHNPVELDRRPVVPIRLIVCSVLYSSIDSEATTLSYQFVCSFHTHVSGFT